MGYSKLPTKVWKDPLGANYLVQLRNNISFVQSIAAREHIVTTGEHNAFEIPRVVRTISGTSVLPSSSDITTVTNPSAGKYVLTLAASRFDADDIRVQLQPMWTTVAKANYAVISDTSIEVYTFEMSSSFGEGDGNTWALTNMPFSIAIHSANLDGGAWDPLPADFARGLNGGGLIGSATHPTPSWSRYVEEMAEVQRVLLAGHTSGGEHNTREIAKISGLVTWDGADYATDSTTIDNIVHNGTGDLTIEFVASYTYHHSFITDLGQELFSAPMAVQDSDTSAQVYLFRYVDTDNWELYDGPFFIVIYGA